MASKTGRVLMYARRLSSQTLNFHRLVAVFIFCNLQKETVYDSDKVAKKKTTTLFAFLYYEAQKNLDLSSIKIYLL